MRIRGLIIGVMLVLGLAGCAAAVPLPNPGQLLYVTTFDAFNEDWQLYEGELSAQVIGSGQNPVLQIAVDDVQAGAFTVMDQLFGDFDLMVEATQVAGPEDIDAPGFGVLFRHQDNQNYYLFMISGDGYYQVARRWRGADRVLSDWAPSPAIRQGQATNAIRVIGQGHTFRFYVNDVQMPLCLTIWNPAVPGQCQDEAGSWSAEAVVMELVDDAFDQGRIGLGARSFDKSGIAVAFDNLLVCGPHDDPPIPYRCEEAPPDVS